MCKSVVSVCDVYPYLCACWLEGDILCPAVFLSTYSQEIVAVTELRAMFVTSKFSVPHPASKAGIIGMHVTMVAL